MVEKAQTQHVQPADAGSMLELLNPKQDIEDILFSMLGLQKVQSRKNGMPVVYVERVNKPIFTDQYCRSLVNDLLSFLNTTVQVSRFDDVDIKRKVGTYLKKLVTSLCTHGDDAYISGNTWKKIVDIHENISEPSKQSGWDDLGIKWEYDMPVNEEMVSLVKDYEEEQDQGIEFDRIVSKFSGMVHASFNKSFSPSPQASGMLLGSMTQIRTESQIVREAENKKWFGGNTFGRGEQ